MKTSLRSNRTLTELQQNQHIEERSGAALFIFVPKERLMITKGDFCRLLSSTESAQVSINNEAIYLGYSSITNTNLFNKVVSNNRGMKQFEHSIYLYKPRKSKDNQFLKRIEQAFDRYNHWFKEWQISNNSWHTQLEKIGCNVLYGAILKQHTSYKVGGRVLAIVEATTIEQLQRLAKLQDQIPIQVVGHLTNILPSDKSLDKVLVQLGGGLSQIILGYSGMYVGAGAKLNDLVVATVSNNLTGILYLWGIPGTVGGAIIGNSGAFGHYIGDYVDKVSVISNEGEVVILDREEITFGYKSCSLREYFAVTGAWIDLEKTEDNLILREKVSEVAEYRKNTQPIEKNSAGCVFKNPLDPITGERISAGKLIDECNLKGTRIGDAVVSDKHANFIVNEGNATATDIRNLIQLIKDRVAQQKEVNLELEVIDLEASY